jgi:hypothetical protein
MQPFISNAKTHASTSYCLLKKPGSDLPHVVSKNSPDFVDLSLAHYEIEAEGSKKEMDDLAQEYFDSLILD